VVVLTSGCNKQQQPNEQKRRCDNQAAATKNKRKRISKENTNTQQKKTMNIFTLIAGGRNQNRRLKHTHATDDK